MQVADQPLDKPAFAAVRDCADADAVIGHPPTEKRPARGRNSSRERNNAAGGNPRYKTDFTGLGASQ